MARQNVVCGDCHSIIKDYLAPNVVIVTDPPYNIKYHYKTYRDNKPIEQYWDELVSLFSLAPSVVIMYPELLYDLSMRLGSAPTKVCSWIYNANTERQHRDIAYFGIKPDFNLYKQPYKDMNDKRVRELFKRTGGARSYDWFPCPQVKNKNKDDGGIGITHPCQMPIDVMKWVVGIIPSDRLIIDPFCGSGSTGVACKALGREFVGIEQDEDYARLAKARIEVYDEQV